jgi:hypothetical protein
MEAIEFTKTHGPRYSDDKYWMVDESWTLGIEAQNCQWTLAGAPAGKLSVCQLSSGPSLNLAPHT